MSKLSGFLAIVAICATPLLAQRTCTVKSYGSSCGTRMTASVQPNGGTVRVRLNVTKTTPRAMVIMAIGDHRLDLPAIGTAPGCRWLVNPVFIQFHQTDAMGFFSHSRAISKTFRGTYHAQFVVFGSTIRTTNGITLECK